MDDSVSLLLGGIFLLISLMPFAFSWPAAIGKSFLSFSLSAESWEKELSTLTLQFFRFGEVIAVEV